MLISYYDHLAICEQAIPQIYSLYKLSLESHRLGYIQFAGDIAYLCAWLISDNGFGEHKKPNPAGLNTIDVYSNNCPIPYCYNRDFPSSEVLSRVNNILLYLLGVYTTDVEQTAIYAYLNYIGNITPVPDDPLEPNRFMYILGMSNVISAEVTPDSDDWETLRYDSNGAIVSESRVSFYNKGDRFIVDRMQANVKRLGSSYNLAVGDSFGYSFVRIPDDVYTMSGLDHANISSKEISSGIYTMSGVDTD